MSAASKKKEDCECGNVEQQIEAVASRVEEVVEDIANLKVEGERRHGERRKDCPHECPAHLKALGLISEVSSAISKISASLHNGRWTYGVVSAIATLAVTMVISSISSQVVDNTEAIKALTKELHGHIERQAQITQAIQSDHLHIKEALTDNKEKCKDVEETLYRHMGSHSH